ncbi:pyridoxine 5'-phosphate synthase [Candidatus Mycalebacterium sp.]
MSLNVNIDHVATLRQARGESEPSPVKAALAAEKAGAAGIVAHLREDRRHIQDADIYELRKSVRTKLNMEMAATDEMVKIALSVLPDMATIVPEKREELTTEGGLDVLGNQSRIKGVISELSKEKIMVSLFIEPDFDQIKAAADIGANMVEIHTGGWACADGIQKENELRAIEKAVFLARELDLRVSAGHGLDYENVSLIAKIAGVEELNIGYAIISRAVFDGIEKAVSSMIKKINTT